MCVCVRGFGAREKRREGIVGGVESAREHQHQHQHQRKRAGPCRVEHIREAPSAESIQCTDGRIGSRSRTHAHRIAVFYLVPPSRPLNSTFFLRLRNKERKKGEKKNRMFEKLFYFLTDNCAGVGGNKRLSKTLPEARHPTSEWRDWRNKRKYSHEISLFLFINISRRFYGRREKCEVETFCF